MELSKKEMIRIPKILNRLNAAMAVVLGGLGSRVQSHGGVRVRGSFLL